MARVTYAVNGKIEGSRSMMIPKQITRLDAWYKEARKVLPSTIPDPSHLSSDWFLSHVVATIDTIIFELHNVFNPTSQARVIIDRNTDAIGM